MGGLLAPDMLRVRDTGPGQHPSDRARTLLAGAGPERSREQLAALTISRRDWQLLELRKRTFGDTLNAFSECPQCGGYLEIYFTTPPIKTTDDDGLGVQEMELY